MPPGLRICWIFATAVLAACSNETIREKPHFEVKSRPPQRPPAAVKSYGLKDNQLAQHLLNADTHIQSGDSQQAQMELDLINQAGLSAEQRGQFNLLQAQVNLNTGDAENALLRLKSIRPVLLSKPDKINYYQSLAFANLLTGNVLQGVSSRIRLGNLLDQPAQQQANISAILDMLSLLPENALNVEPDIASELRGWMALARILKQRNQAGADIMGQIQQWRQDYPGHPANAEYLQAYLSAPQPEAQAPETSPATAQTRTEGFVAVLLPTSGPYAPAGKAVKAGMQAAYRLAASSAPHLPLKFYDSAQEDIADLYSQAVTDGAQKIVGPLVKEQIAAMVKNTELSVPVLALNHVDELYHSRLYQFGLSPIDEADALAGKAHADGLRSALVLVPGTAQGQRIGNYLTSSWQKRGGTVAGVQSYDPKQHNIAESLNQLIASSAYPDGQQPPRAVLLSANAETARELAPQLKYLQNAKIAVYAMPTIFSGKPNPLQDADLGLFSFCDVPWLFADYYGGPLSQSALQNSWQELPESVIRLLALGIDAYNLLEHLDQLAATPYAGASGRLSLSGENRIVRKLVCAKYQGGVPVATGFSD
ncbi:MAG: penicillin-binding protein activator [Methylomonas sp.]|nr:penicillin-binding protein activator [Methylomonas sp.]